MSKKIQELITRFEELNKALKKDGCAEQDMVAMSERQPSTGIKGVHVGANPDMPGRSKMGLMNRIGVTPRAKDEAKATLKEMKAMPKPNLEKGKESLSIAKNGQWCLDKSEFKRLQHKIEAQGHSPESAAAITASIGRKEIGQKAMTRRAKAAMNKVDPEENVNIPHPQKKAKVMPMVGKAEGTNQKLANPPEKDVSSNPNSSKVRHVKQSKKDVEAHGKDLNGENKGKVAGGIV